MFTGGFIDNLTSELPALRPLSVMALMFLLQPTICKTTKNGSTPLSSRLQNATDETSIASIISSAFQTLGFGEEVLKHLALDHNYAEGQTTYQSSSMNDMGLTALMPSLKREWPYTRTWDDNSCGELFNWYYAKLFKLFVRESGKSVLQALREPLEEAVGAVEERGKQCIAAEVVAGLLRSGTHHKHSHATFVQNYIHMYFSSFHLDLINRYCSRASSSIWRSYRSYLKRRNLKPTPSLIASHATLKLNLIPSQL